MNAPRQRGSSMVIVLVMIAVFGLMLAAIGTQGQVGVMANAGVREQRADQYAAAGAMDGAINRLRGNQALGREGVTCPSFSTSSAAGPVTVSCTPQAGSGAVQAGPDFPAYALLTTAGLPGGYGGGTGISASGGTNSLKIDGPTYSNTTISGRVDAGDDPIGARQSCSATVVGMPVKCNTATNVADPGSGYNVEPPPGSPWASPVQAVPAGAPGPTCNAANRVATMQPGSYFDLAAMTTAIATCTVVWMQPGNYYFDWGIANASNTRWSIAKTVVGGTPSGWSPSASSSPSVPVPGACDRGAPGVHLVFGANSRLDVAGNGTLELCPTPAANAQDVVLYGRKTSTTSTLVPASTYRPTVAVSASPPTLASPPASVLAIDGLSNSGVISGRRAVGQLVTGGYPLSAIPAGSRLNSVQVRISHAESTSTTNRITIAAGSKVLCNSLSVPWRASLTTDTISCPANQIWTAAADAQATFTVTRPNDNGSTTVTVDGIELLIAYTPPVLRQQTLGTVLVSMATTGRNRGRIYAWGSVYAPYSILSINFANNSEAAFQRGAVILRFSGSSMPPAPVLSAFGLDGVNPYADRSVALEAQIGGKRQLRAVVQYGDTPDPGTTVRTPTWTSVN